MNHDALAQFPTLRVRNKTGASQQLLYLNDSVQIMPGAARNILSKGLLQIPDPKLFEFVKPTLFELEAAGVVDLGRGYQGSTGATGSTGSTGATASPTGSTSSSSANATTDSVGATGSVGAGTNNATATGSTDSSPVTQSKNS